MTKPQEMAMNLAAALRSQTQSNRRYAQATRDFAESIRAKIDELGISMKLPELDEAIRDAQASQREILCALAQLQKAVDHVA